MKNDPLSAFIKTFQSCFMSRFKLERPVSLAGGHLGKWCCLWVAMGLALALPAKAQIIYQTDFSGAEGTLPDSWTSRVQAGSYALDGGGHLVYSTTANQGSARAYWIGDAGSITDGVMADVRITSLLQWPSQSSNQSIGILGRVQDVSVVNPLGYFVGIYRMGGANYLIIAKDPSGAGFGTILDQVQLSLTTNTAYLLEATFSGNELTASLYDASGENQLATSLSVTDTAYETGVFGVSVRAESANRKYIFDNYTIMAIPEPSPVAMLVGAGAVLGFIVSRKRKKAGARVES